MIGPRKRLIHVKFLERVLPCLQHAERDLLARGNYVERIRLYKAAQNRHLRAQHVAFGNVGQNLFGRGLHLGESRLQIDIA